MGPRNSRARSMYSQGNAPLRYVHLSEAKLDEFTPISYSSTNARTQLDGWIRPEMTAGSSLVRVSQSHSRRMSDSTTAVSETEVLTRHVSRYCQQPMQHTVKSGTALDIYIRVYQRDVTNGAESSAQMAWRWAAGRYLGTRSLKRGLPNVLARSVVVLR